MDTRQSGYPCARNGPFMHYDLGFFDHETGRIECAENLVRSSKG
jgi:hypothetical protein